MLNTETIASTIIDKSLLAKYSISNITVLVEKKDPFNPSSPDLTSIIIKPASSINFTKDTAGSLAYDNKVLSRKTWQNWSALRHAIIRQRNYLIEHHYSQSGFFNCLICTSNFTWLTPITKVASSSKARVLPKNHWINISKRSFNKKHHDFEHTISYLLESLPKAKSNLDADRMIRNSHLHVLKYQHNNAKRQYFIGIGYSAIRAVADHINFLSDTLRRLPDVSDYSTVNSYTKRLAKDINALKKIEARPNRFYRFENHTDTLVPASIKGLIVLVKHIKKAYNY